MLEQILVPQICSASPGSSSSDLAHEIRQFLIHKVAATGGHLGPNLGVVELTVALHRVFDSPHDPIIFDTGHQAYVHKMLTGRCHDFDRCAKRTGCRATRRGPKATTTGWNPATRPRRCPTPTGWRRRSS